jgi:hypothetical protein
MPGQEWPPAWLVKLAQNPVTRGVVKDLFTQNPEFAEAVHTAVRNRGDGWPVFVDDWDNIKAHAPGGGEGLASAIAWGMNPDSTAFGASIGVDVDRIHELVQQDSARARELVRDALVHEFAHLIPVARSGHMRDATGDPEPGDRNAHKHPVIQKENKLRGLLNLPPKGSYGLLR